MLHMLPCALLGGRDIRRQLTCSFLRLRRAAWPFFSVCSSCRKSFTCARIVRSPSVSHPIAHFPLSMLAVG